MMLDMYPSSRWIWNCESSNFSGNGSFESWISFQPCAKTKDWSENWQTKGQMALAWSVRPPLLLKLNQQDLHQSFHSCLPLKNVSEDCGIYDGFLLPKKQLPKVDKSLLHWEEVQLRKLCWQSVGVHWACVWWRRHTQKSRSWFVVPNGPAMTRTFGWKMWENALTRIMGTCRRWCNLGLGHSSPSLTIFGRQDLWQSFICVHDMSWYACKSPCVSIRLGFGVAFNVD